MKRTSKFLTCFLIFVMLSNPLTAFANTYGESFSKGMDISYVMEMIVENYAGEGDINYETLYQAAIRGMSEALDDYSYYMSEEDLNAFLVPMNESNLLFGISFSLLSGGDIIVTAVQEGSSAFEQGVKAGDILIRANGADIKNMDLDSAINQLYNYQGQFATIVFLRNNAEMTFSIERRNLPNQTVYSYKLSELMDGVKAEDTSHIRLIYITSIGEATHTELETLIAKLKAEGVTQIILDLRGNAGGHLSTAVEICKMLVTKGLLFTEVEGIGKRIGYYSTLKEAPFEKTSVLVDYNTASAAEIIASCLQDYGSTVVGTLSYGKGCGQEFFTVPGGGYLKLTTLEIFSPRGSKINTVGITPNILVEIPDLLEENLETLPGDILAVKKILKFCGLETGNMDTAYDEVTKKTVAGLKEQFGLGAGDNIDVYFKAKLNDYYRIYFYNNDKILGKAYEYMIGK